MKENYEKTGICSICGKRYEHWGNNAQPVNDGRCCDDCNTMYVIPARIIRFSEMKKPARA